MSTILTDSDIIVDGKSIPDGSGWGLEWDAGWADGYNGRPKADNPSAAYLAGYSDGGLTRNEEADLW